MSFNTNLELLSEVSRKKISTDLEVSPKETKYGKKESVLCFDTFDDDKDNCYVSLPFAYVHRNMRKELQILFPNDNIVYPRASGYTFDGTLNTVQQEIKDQTYDILNRTRSILISLFCGAGKTAYSIFLCTKLQYKTCVLCHRINLIDQWEYAIHKFCPEALVQVLQGNTPIDKDADFYIMNVSNVGKKTTEDFNHVGILVVDECFPGDTYVMTSDGNKKIKDLHNTDVEKRPLIYSLNRDTKTFEYKKMTNSWEKHLVKSIVEIYMGRNGERKIVCTSDHKILTNNGYVRALDLTLGTKIVAGSSVNNNIYGHLKVTKLLLFNKYNEKFVYDIEVEDNHNFIIATNIDSTIGPVVSNCHTICTENLSKSLFYFKPKYLIGLTATPDRTDGMGKILDLYFGDERISRKLYRPFNTYVYNTGFKPKSEQNAQGRLDWNSVLSSQGSDNDRNEIIVDTIRYFKSRNFLVLCKRVDQANILLNKLKNVGEDVDIFVSTSRKFNRESRILISTYSKTGVGFDHPRLDALIIASDVEEGIEQYVGRVFRREDVVPIIFDFLDKMHTLFKHFLTRRLLYLSIGGEVKQFTETFPEFVQWRKTYKIKL